MEKKLGMILRHVGCETCWIQVTQNRVSIPVWNKFLSAILFSSFKYQLIPFGEIYIFRALGLLPLLREKFCILNAVLKCRIISPHRAYSLRLYKVVRTN